MLTTATTPTDVEVGTSCGTNAAATQSSSPASLLVYVRRWRSSRPSSQRSSGELSIKRRLSMATLRVVAVSSICAGCFTATNTLSILAEVFEAAGALDRLEAFTSLNGPAFYGLEPNADTVTLSKGPAVAYPPKLQTGDGPVTLFDPGFPLHWSVG